MKVSIYIGSKDYKGIPISDNDRNSTLLQCATVLSKKYGGATVQNSVGYYMSQELNSIMQEDIKILYSSTKKITYKDRKDIRALALDVKKNLRQESVMVEFGNSAEFI